MALGTNLLHYYNFDETSGNLIDQVGSNDGTLGGGVTREATGKINDSYDFNNSSTGVVTLGADISQLNGSDFSISFWAYNDEASGTCIIGEDADQGTGQTLTIGKSNSAKTMFIDFKGATRLDSSQVVDLNEWEHWVFTYNAATNERILYRDGSADTNDTATNDYTGPGGFRIGRPYYSADYFSGMIDEMGIWDKVLSPSEVSELNNSDAGLAYPFSTNVTLTPSALALSLTGPATTTIVLDAPLSLSTSLASPAPTTEILLSPPTFALSLSLLTPALEIISHPNRGTVSTKEISKLSIPSGIGDTMNLVPETSHVLSKCRVGLEL